MRQQDIRWKQRFENYKTALARLTTLIEAIENRRDLTDRDQLSIIKMFEIVFELGWNVMKDFLTRRGITDIIGSRDAVRQAFHSGLIGDGHAWIDMIKSRNLAAHKYDEADAKQLAENILTVYYPEFLLFEKTMEAK
jgi:nucleotidyltransferase substrate binding protein (TIGR01987 family)